MARTAISQDGRAAPGVIAMPAIAHNVMAAAMRNLNTFKICFSVFTVESAIAHHVEIGQGMPRWLSMVSRVAFSKKGVHFVLQNQSAKSRRIKALEGAMMI
jgi:hypothetical protein